MIKERQAVFSQNTKTVLQTDHIIRIKQGSNSPPQPKKSKKYVSYKVGNEPL